LAAEPALADKCSRYRWSADTDAYVYTAAHDALRRLGACRSDDAARSAVERAVGTEEGMLWLESRRADLIDVTPEKQPPGD
jgi:hypothetical protein